MCVSSQSTINTSVELSVSVAPPGVAALKGLRGLLRSSHYKPLFILTYLLSEQV